MPASTTMRAQPGTAGSAGMREAGAGGAGLALIGRRRRRAARRPRSAGHLVECRDHVVEVGVRHPGVERQRQQALVGGLGDREAQAWEPRLVVGVPVDRDVVDVDPDPLGPEGVEDRAAVDGEAVEPQPHEHEVPGRVRARIDRRQLERRVAGQPVHVARGEPAPPGQPLLETLELRAAERRRDIGQPVVVAEVDHRVGPVAAGGKLGLDAVVAEAAQGGGQVVAVGQDRPTLARRHDLGRMEAEDGHVGQRPDRPALERRAERVRGVGDDRQRPARRGVGDRPECRVVGRLAGVVDRDDRPRPFRDRRCDGAGIDQQRVGVDIGETRRGTRVEHRVGAGDERHRRRDRLVTRPETRDRGRPMECGGPRTERHGVAGAGRLDQPGLELRDARAGGQPLGAQRRRDCLDVALFDDLVGVRQQRRADGFAAVDRERGPDR